MFDNLGTEKYNKFVLEHCACPVNVSTSASVQRYDALALRLVHVEGLRPA